MLRFAAGAVAAGLAPLALHAQSGAARIEAPSAPMILTRKLVRGLRGGTSLSVTRSWRLVFEQRGRGIAITGDQIAVAVEAPPALAPISRIEEERSTAGMFPILLADDGMIVAAGESTTAESVDRAIAAGLEVLRTHGMPEEETAMHASILGEMQRAGATLLETMPPDLFYPATTPSRTVRAIALPDGGAGEFEVSWRASVQPGTALLAEARREVVTRIGADERRSSEDWSLTPE
ncbi:MAG: hypothetical protein V2J14_07965 [Erythrobacter sp.]|jgi:hypothetical protein|nr:hypothetical protein [Erythrobacter sp.]